MFQFTFSSAFGVFSISCNKFPTDIAGLPLKSATRFPLFAYFGKINYDISTKRAIVHCADTEIFAGYQMTPPTRARAANLIYVEFTSEDELRNGNAKCAARGAAGTAKAAVIRQRNLEEIRSQVKPSCFNSTVWQIECFSTAKEGAEVEKGEEAETKEEKQQKLKKLQQLEQYKRQVECINVEQKNGKNCKNFRLGEAEIRLLRMGRRLGWWITDRNVHFIDITRKRFNEDFSWFSILNKKIYLHIYTRYTKHMLDCYKEPKKDKQTINFGIV